jgi:ATP-dependent helicase HrpA
VTAETVTLYGLPVVSGRTVGYDRVDAVVARAMFLRHALVEGDWDERHRFLARNREVIERVRAMGDRVRRADVLDDDVVVELYDEIVPEGIVSGRHFDRWWKQESTERPALLDLSEERLAAGIRAGFRRADFPDTWEQDGLELALTYRYDPGGPLDGVSVHVPLTALGQLRDEGFDWQVPGHREELVEALVRTLPKDVRRQLIPLAETTDAAWSRLGPPSGRLVDALAAALGEVSRGVVDPAAFDAERLPAHLRMSFVVHDDAGTVVDAGWDLAAIRTRQAAAARDAVARVSPLEERTRIVEWDLGTIPQEVAAAAGGHTVRGYPALLDDGDSVSLRVLTNPALQQRVMRGGVRRLLALTAAPSVRSVARDLPGGARLTLASAGTTPEDLAGDCLLSAVDRVMDDHGALPWDEPAFAALRREVRDRVPRIARDALGTAVDVLDAAQRVRAHLDRLVAAALQPSADDAAAHLDRLVRPGFVRVAGTRRLPDVHRYVRAIEHRLERLAGGVPGDQRRMAEVVPLERRYAELLGRFGRSPAPAEVVELGWELEELRVSLFAQPLGAKGSVSAKRISRALTALTASTTAAPTTHGSGPRK